MLYNVSVWIEFHKLLIVEFLLFVHEVSSLTYCQEGHLGILGYLSEICEISPSEIF